SGTPVTVMVFGWLQLSLVKISSDGKTVASDGRLETTRIRTCAVGEAPSLTASDADAAMPVSAVARAALGLTRISGTSGTDPCTTQRPTLTSQSHPSGQDTPPSAQAICAVSGTS